MTEHSESAKKWIEDIKGKLSQADAAIKTDMIRKMGLDSTPRKRHLLSLQTSIREPLITITRKEPTP